MDSLGGMFNRFLSFPDFHIPEDGVCPSCDKLRRHHQGVEQVLALRGFKYHDPTTGKMVVNIPGPIYCGCKDGG